MGRKSLAERFYDEVEVENTRSYEWAVIYDFHGGKPNRNFYDNLKRLREMLPDSGMEQYSVFRTKDLKGALTAWKLAEHYGAETAVFRVEELHPGDPENIKKIHVKNLNPYQAWLVMIAVRDQIEKVKRGSVEHWHLLNVLRRFQELRNDVPIDGERQILEDTRKLLDPRTPTELLYDAWISKHEVEAILKALFRYICTDIGDMEGRIKFLMHHSIKHTLQPAYRKVKRR